MKDDAARLKEIRRLEERLLRPGTRKSPRDLTGMIADDFIEIGSSGRTYDKQQVIEALGKEDETQISIADFETRALAEGVVLATYVALKNDGSAGPVKRSLRSSIWKLDGGEWRVVFHQGTPVAEG